MVLVVTLENVCDRDLEISVNMVQCCEVLNANENDCGYMYLIGGHMGILFSKTTKNVTLIYPNTVNILLPLFNYRLNCLSNLFFMFLYLYLKTLASRRNYGS